MLLYIQTISNRSTTVLNFIKQNLNNCPSDTKRTAYLLYSYIHHESSGWWIISEYTRTASVTSLLFTLKICTSQPCCQSSALTLLYKIITAYYLSLFLHIWAQFHTRQHHLNHFISPYATLNTYKNSFYPRTIKDWNNLPINMIESRDFYLILLNY